MDGHYYEGEEENSQFGVNPNVSKEWFGAQFGLPEPERYDFLSEGDSPTYLLLFDWGFRTLEDFSYGGIAGRYQKLAEETNSRGEELNYWDVTRDMYTDRNGKDHLTEPMWRYTADIQRDFAARVAWAAGEEGEYAPSLEIAEGLDHQLLAGETLTLCAKTSESAAVSFRIYPEISSDWAKEMPLEVQENAASFTVPTRAVSGGQLHIIVKAQAGGHHRLVHYQQVIITVK